jgi:hypothetical protein
MRPGLKLALDLLFGAVIPILILNYLTQTLTAPVAYVVAALVPVAWVAIDLLFITRTFNYITSYIGLSAIVSGALAFWFVDGLLFALKDSASYIVACLVFGGSLLVGRPLLNHFFAQVVQATTPERRQAVHGFLALPDMHRSVALGTLIIFFANLALGMVNFWLNATIVVAPFGGEEFNQQVARVNSITRVLFPLPSLGAFAGALYLMFRTAYRRLPLAPGESPFEADFWAALDQHQATGASQRGAAPVTSPRREDA